MLDNNIENTNLLASRLIVLINTRFNLIRATMLKDNIVSIRYRNQEVLVNLGGEHVKTYTNEDSMKLYERVKEYLPDDSIKRFFDEE